MNSAPQTPPQRSALPLPDEGKNSRAERAVGLLYLFFFLIWSLGLVLAFVPGAGQLTLWGLPLWFSVSCLAAYAAVCAALAFVAGRYFK